MDLAGPTHPEGDAPRRGSGRRAGWWLATAGALAVAFLAVAALLWSPPLTTHVLNLYFEERPLAPGTVLTFTRMAARGPLEWQLTGVRWTRGDTLLAAIDTARVGLRVGPLLRRRIELRVLELGGVVVTDAAVVRRTPQAAPPRPLTLADVLRGRFYAGPPLVVDRLVVRDARWSQRDPATNRLRHVVLVDLRARASLGPSFGFDIERLVGHAGPQDAPDSAIVLRLEGGLADGRVAARRLQLGGGGNAFAGRAHLALDRSDAIGEVGLAGHAKLVDLAFLARFVPGLDLDGAMNADVDLRGPRLDRLTGTVTAAGDRARVQGLALVSPRADLRLDEGRAEGRVVATAEEAPLELTGWIRPFDRQPAFELTARAARLPSRLPGVDGWPAFAARNAATSLEIAAASAGDSTLPARVTLEARGPAGRVDGTGTVVLARGGAWSVERLTFRDLDLARLAGGEHVVLAGTLTAAGHLRGGPDSSLALALVLDEARGHTWRIVRGRVRATLAGAQARGALELEGDAGALAVASIVARLDGAGTLRVEGGRFRDLDLARLAGVPSLAGRFAGTLRGEAYGLRALGGPGGPGEALRTGRTGGRLELALAGSRLRDATIERGTLRLDVSGGRVRIASALDADAGRLALAGTARPFAEPWDLAVTEARFTGVDLAAWTGNRALGSSLTGSVQGTAEGGGSWSALVDLERSRFVGRGVDGGTIRVSGENARARGSAHFVTAGDTASLGGDVTLAGEDSHGRLEASLPLGLLAGLAGHDTLAARGGIVAHVDFTGPTPATMRAHGSLAGRGRLGEATLDTLAARFDLAGGVLGVDTLLARSNAGHARGAGTLALFDTTGTGEADLRLDLALRDAAPLRPLLRADTLAGSGGTLAVRVHGQVGRRRVEARGTLRSGTWNDVRVLGGDLVADGRLDRDGRIVQAEVEAKARRFRAFGWTGQGTARGGYEEGEARFDIDVSDAAAHRLRLAATARPDSSGALVTLETLDVDDDTTAWRLARPARLDLREDRARIEDFELRSREGSVVAGGVVDRRGTQDLRIEARRVGVGSLARAFGRPHLDGTLDGHFALHGAAATPAGDGMVAIDLVSAGQPAGTLRSTLDWDGRQARLAGRFTAPGGDSLAGSGVLPLALSLAPATGDSAYALRLFDGDVDVALAATRFPLAALSPLLDPQEVGPLAGTLDLDLRLRGTGHALAGSGRLDLAGGRVPLPGSGVRWSDVALAGRLEGDRFVVERAQAAAGKGRLDLSGDVRLESATRIEPRLHADLARFPFVDTPGLRAVASGGVDIAGTLARPALRGNLTFLDSHFEIVPAAPAATAADAEVRLTAEDVMRLEEEFGFVEPPAPHPLAALYEASALDLAIDFERDNWIRQRREPRFAIALDGDVRLTKDPEGETLLLGRITPVPRRGFVEQFARSFDITGGELQLNGRPADHRVDLHAEYRPPSADRSNDDDVRIRLDVTGPFDKLELALTSEPPMDETEIVSYIATGRSNVPGVGDPNAKDDAGSLAADIGISGLTGGAQMAAQEAIGLDVLQVRFDALDGATLVAGRYVDPKVYVGFLQPLQYKDDGSPTSNALARTRFEVEYAFQRWLVLNVKGESTELRSFLRVRHEY